MTELERLKAARDAAEAAWVAAYDAALDAAHAPNTCQSEELSHSAG